MIRTTIDTITRVLLICGAVAFFIAEAFVAVALRGVSHPVRASRLLNVYCVCAILAIPAIVGAKGFLASSVPPRSDAADSVMGVLRRQYLFGIIWTYVAVILIIEMIA